MDYLSLSLEEKISSVKSQIKSLEYTKYETELRIGQEQSLPSPNTTQIEVWQSEYDEFLTKQQYLVNELTTLEAQRGENV